MNKTAKPSTLTPSSRETILATIRRGLNRDKLTNEQCDALQQHLYKPNRTIQPQRIQLDAEQAVTVFIDMAKQAATEIILIHDMAEIPQHIQTLQVVSPQTPLVLANEPVLQTLAWQTMATTTRVAQKGDKISLTSCIAGVAETGTVVMKSTAHSPTSLNFLPDIHCVVLRQQDIVNSYEDAWDIIRQEALPRTVNFITGPSRSADIEQKLQMGAHGPKRFIVFLALTT